MLTKIIVIGGALFLASMFCALILGAFIRCGQGRENFEAGIVPPEGEGCEPHGPTPGAGVTASVSNRPCARAAAAL